MTSGTRALATHHLRTSQGVCQSSEFSDPFLYCHLPLQNSLRAVVERCGKDGVDGNGTYPPIKVIVVEGKEDITVSAVSSIPQRCLLTPHTIHRSRSATKVAAFPEALSP
jgi:hypothetical protein